MKMIFLSILVIRSFRKVLLNDIWNMCHFRNCILLQCNIILNYWVMFTSNAKTSFCALWPQRYHRCQSWLEWNCEQVFSFLRIVPNVCLVYCYIISISWNAWKCSKFNVFYLQTGWANGFERRSETVLCKFMRFRMLLLTSSRA